MIILDLDNCISNDGWRIPRIDWEEQDNFKRYHPYHSLCHWDLPGNQHLFEGVADPIIIVTGRPEHYRKPTVAWLKVRGVPFNTLLMRPDNNSQLSPQLKQFMVAEFLLRKKIKPTRIHCAYDDHQGVVNAYRAIGITAAVIRIHDISAYNGEER